MKTIKTIIAAVACLLAMNTQAQTADEVVAKYVAAMGGAEKINSTNSVKMEGSLSVQGMDIPISQTVLNKKGMRLDIDVMGTTGYQVANTSKGFRFFPFQGDTEPVEMSAEEFALAKDRMDLTNEYLNAKELGNKLEFVGKEDVDGAPAYKLKLTKANGKEVMAFFDEKTAFLVRTVSKENINGSEMEITSTNKDYKQTAEGFWYPHTIESSVQGTISFSKITVNSAVDEKIFNP